MPNIEIIVHKQDAGSTSSSVLPDAWIYWKENSAISILRSDSTGNLKRLKSGGEATYPWDYTDQFTAASGSQAEIFYSTGSKPIPVSVLNANTTIFTSFTINPSTTATVNQNTTTTANLSNTAQIILQTVICSLTQPAELTLWPLLKENYSSNYYTDGINQGGALWTSTTGSGSLTVTENGAATAPSSTVRPRDRGLEIAGTIDSRATGVQIQIVDNSGTIIQLRQDATSNTNVNEVNATLGAVSGTTKSFEATIYFSDSAQALGPIQIVIKSVGITPPIIGTFAVHLSGFQMALINDYSANQNGQQRGPILDESNEINIIDFQNSPQNSRPNISAQTRARRMIGYQLANRNRSLSATNATNVLKPEMPLWMVEGQIIGLSKVQLEDLMLRRKNLLSASPTSLSISWQFNLTLSWDGPDSGTTSPRRYSYNQSFSHTLSATFNLNNSNQIDGVNSQGEVANALSPTQAALNFPVTGRRIPKAIVSGLSRSWSKENGAQQFDSLICEWQPHIINTAGNEIIRGGDGILEAEIISIDGTRIDRGVIVSGSGTAQPPANYADCELPTFRVRGLNPPSPANAVINALVEDYYNNHNTLPRITLLPLACWQETVRRILAHEAGHQFEHRGAGRRKFAGNYYGHEQDMPIFGGPHGYGYGQHDNPPVTDDGAWSFFENIKESVRRIMEDKATAAYNHINGHLPTPLDQRIRAVYQRETVRRYNGGREFEWSGTAWRINPSINQWADPSDHSRGANPRLRYPNTVLGTNVVYHTGSGASTTFPWPITFNSSDFGPGT